MQKSKIKYQKQIQNPKIKNISAPILKLPVESEYKIEHGFGDRGSFNPFDSLNRLVHLRTYRVYGGFHPGVDFGLPIGSPVFSPFNGVVVRAEQHKGMGWVLSVRNGNILALSGHLSELKAKLGEVVSSGQVIALSGNTGEATQRKYPHVHFELRNLEETKLAKMVFKPEFNQPIDCWRETFVYRVNNKEIPKSLGLLAKRYFGNEDRWGEIVEANTSLKGLGKDDKITDGLEITIPNFI